MEQHDICQRTASRHCVVHAIGMFLLLFLAAESLAAGEESAAHDPGEATSAAVHGPVALVTPLAVDKDALFPVDRSVTSRDADHWPFALVAPAAAGVDSRFAVSDIGVNTREPRSDAPACPWRPGE